jgi:hypothetical protein
MDPLCDIFPDMEPQGNGRAPRVRSKRWWMWFGILAWGVPVFLGAAIWDHLLTWQSLRHLGMNWPTADLAGRLALWTVAGIFFGLQMARGAPRKAPKQTQ